MECTAYNKWFFTARDPETGLPYGTLGLHRVCDNNPDKFTDLDKLLEIAFNAGMDAAK